LKVEKILKTFLIIGYRMPTRQYENSILYAVRAKNGDEDVGVTTNLTQRRALIKRGGSQHSDFIVAHGGWSNVVIVPLRKVSASDPLTQSLEKEKFLSEKRSNVISAVEPSRLPTDSVFGVPLLHRRDEVEMHCVKPKKKCEKMVHDPAKLEAKAEKTRRKREPKPVVVEPEPEPEEVAEPVPEPAPEPEPEPVPVPKKRGRRKL